MIIIDIIISVTKIVFHFDLFIAEKVAHIAF